MDCIFQVVNVTKIIVICLNVDVLLIIGSSPVIIESLKQSLKKEFEIT